MTKHVKTESTVRIGSTTAAVTLDYASGTPEEAVLATVLQAAQEALAGSESGCSHVLMALPALTHRIRQAS